MIINNDANPTGFGQSESDYIGFEPSPLDWTKLENTFQKKTFLLQVVGTCIARQIWYLTLFTPIHEMLKWRQGNNIISN